eukprot:359491-Chlamydomonas_euryale.AAC.4
MPHHIIKSTMWQLLNGLNYLHQNWILHRDLKARQAVSWARGVRHGHLYVKINHGLQTCSCISTGLGAPTQPIGKKLLDGLCEMLGITAVQRRGVSNMCALAKNVRPMAAQLQPSNVLVMGDDAGPAEHGRVKIADFGLARIFQVSKQRGLAESGNKRKGKKVLGQLPCLHCEGHVFMRLGYDVGGRAVAAAECAVAGMWTKVKNGTADSTQLGYTDQCLQDWLGARPQHIHARA